MKKLLSTFATLLAVLISVTLIVPLAACSPIGPGGQGQRTVKITNKAGYGLENVELRILDGNKEIAKGTTNADGEYKTDFNDGTYNLEINADTLPKGYYLDRKYTLNGSDNTFTFSLPSKVIEEEAPLSVTYGVGSIMYDFTLATVYSYTNYDSATKTLTPVNNLKLSDVLKEKKAVLLNFWYTTCTYCVQEFPHMNNAYLDYADDLSILAIDNYPEDNDRAVGEFTISQQLSFDLSMDSAGIVSRFNISGYPTSFMIDRYGMVCARLSTTTDEQVWRNLFEKYTADNYETGDIEIDDNDPNFVPEKPEDHGVVMSDPKEINDVINNTGTDITFSTDVSVWSWPWRISADGQSIYSTNTGYRQTIGLIYAKMNFEANKALVFEYKFTGMAGTDYFRVSVDGRYGLGLETIFIEEGDGWTKGVAYIALEHGSHEVSFSYGKLSTLPNDSQLEDTAYIRNLHFEDISEIADMDVNIPYFAARGQNAETGKFAHYESVYKDSNGYYRIGNERNANDATDPYLYVSLSTPSPFFQNYQSSIFANYINPKQCVFDGIDYYDTLNSYSIYAANSTVSLSATSGNVVPVREDLKDALEALYNSTNSPSDEHYSEYGWLEFCSFFKQFGNGLIHRNPIEGLAYFSAFEAKETTGIPDSGDLNVATFNRLLMPRGYLYKFVPKTSGVYKFESIGDVWTDVDLYDGFMDTAPAHYPSLNSCGYDYFPRYIEDLEDDKGSANVNFLMYHYLEAGETYYVGVAFHVVDELGSFKFRIDRIGDTFKYLSTATGGIYTSTGGNEYSLPVYVDVAYNKTDDVFYDTKTGEPIYCDFTACSRMFDLYSIEKLLDDSNTNIPKGAFNLKGASITIDGVTYEGEDYTETMRKYLEKAKSRDKNDELYGMVEVDFELQKIIKMFFQKNVGFDDEGEWLKACWYYVHLGPNA